MREVLIQYERLRRHYEVVEKTYDYASFLDLSHILRIWCELKTALPKYSKSAASMALFKSAVPNRKILKSHSKTEYIVAFMPGGTTSHATDGRIFSCKKDIDIGGFSVGGNFSKLNDGPLTLYSFFLCDPTIKVGTSDIISNPKVSRLNFSQWLGAEAARMNFKRNGGNLESVSIPREILIKRLANTLDASHTSLNSPEESENKFDEPIKYLMNFNWGGCPLPYYLLLKVAQDIVNQGPKLIGSIKNA